MRVAFDARALEARALAERGIGRYASSLLAALLAADRPVVPLRGLRPGRLAAAVRRARADLVHQPAVDHASLRPGAPLVVTLHDLAPLKHPGLYLRTGLRFRARYAAVKRAARVIVPSAVVADDAERLLGIATDRIDVIAEAPAPVFRPVADPRASLARLPLPERFMLWVGGLDPPDPRKGLPELARLAAPDLPLVIAGRLGPEGAALARPGAVIPVGRLGDGELAALYSAADVFVFPSSDEGFGLPPLEALACGTPVAAFAAGALPDTLADAEGARLVDPGDMAALLTAAIDLAGTTGSAPPRTWTDVAAETWTAYESAGQVPDTYSTG